MILNLQHLNRAHLHVLGELQSLGFWSRQMDEIGVWLVPFAWNCFGWQNYGTDGAICIPAFSGARLHAWIRGHGSCTLREVLRHEWAHAFAHCHYHLVDRPSFVRAFDGEHDGGAGSAFDPGIHVSAYASSQPMEDFAENFMYFVRHRGILPGKWRTPAIAKRWRFIDALRKRTGNR